MGSPDLHHHVGLQKVFPRQAEIGKAEFRQALQNLLRIPLAQGHEHIKIARVTRKPVNTHGVTANHQVLNLSVFE